MSAGLWRSLRRKSRKLRDRIVYLFWVFLKPKEASIMVSLKQIFLYIGQMSFHIRLSLNFICFLYIRLYIILLSTFSKLFARFVYIYFVTKKYNFSFLFLKFISLITRVAPIKLLTAIDRFHSRDRWPQWGGETLRNIWIRKS
jgi:hypothetical protein